VSALRPLSTAAFSRLADDNPTGVCLVVGAGDATGLAVARAFAEDGFTTVLVRRNKGGGVLEANVEQLRSEGHQCYGFAKDARDEEAVGELVRTIESQIGPIEVRRHLGFGMCAARAPALC
jgi:NAD(P)-dependent dehydrogenase (short-subunit alcohol dehydrogenase family)